MTRQKKAMAVGLALAVLLTAVALTGCSLLPFGRPSGKTGEDPVTPGPGQGEMVLRLYFGDKQAMYLLPEDRTVTAPAGKTYEQLVIEELITGPKLADQVRTIPPEAKLLSLEIVEGVAYVNFSIEIQTKHWGGSTGELFTIYSIVNSLTESPNVTAVQFLIEGKRVESLVGHVDATKPIERNADMISGGK